MSDDYWVQKRADDHWLVIEQSSGFIVRVCMTQERALEEVNQLLKAQIKTLLLEAADVPLSERGFGT